MKRLLLLSIAAILPLFGVCNSQNFVSNEGIQSAIVEGKRAKGRFQGLELQDMGVGFGQALIGGMAGAHLPTGYRVVIYSPLEWIRQKASDAGREYREFSAKDLTPSMVENVIRVRVYPSLPTYVTARGTMLASSVDHLVIRDAQRQRVVQPLRMTHFSESAQNAMGASVAYHGTDATFDIKEVEVLRDQTEEFYITIVGTLGERNVKVKRRALAKLAFLQINAAGLDLAPEPQQLKPPEAVQTAMQKSSTQASAYLPKALTPSDSAKPDEIVVAADALLQSLRKAEAAFKVSAPTDMITAALMDAQLRLDEIQHRGDKERLGKTIESAAFALRGFIDARERKSNQPLTSAREALESAAKTLDAFKVSGREPNQPTLIPVPETIPPVAATAPRRKEEKYPSVIVIK